MTRHDDRYGSGRSSPARHEDEFNVVEEAEMLRLDIDLGRVWSCISGEIWAAPVGRVEQSAAGLLRSPALARALVSTPSLVLSWLLASAVVFAVGGVVMWQTGTPVVPLVAPVLAAAGVAFAYGAAADPAWELARTMPTSARMVLLVRVVAVLATNVLLGAVASLLAPGLSGVTVLWLMPMLAIALLALALATVARSPAIGGAGALAVWGAIVLAAQIRWPDEALSALTPSTLAAAAPFYALLAAASVLVVARMSADVTSAARPRGGSGRW